MECVPMLTFITRVSGIAILALLATGCMYNRANSDDMKPTDPHTVALDSGAPVGGYIEQFMDGKDRTKLSKALDKGIGNTTAWDNPESGAHFAVTPIRKVQSENGGICRAYTVKMTKTGITDRVQGTACIGGDGSWKVVS